MTALATPIPFGSESPPWPATDDGRCPDCGVPAGECHVPNCDVEECPICGRQLLSCGHHDDVATSGPPPVLRLDHQPEQAA